jgi:hypothetical protein
VIPDAVIILYIKTRYQQVCYNKQTSKEVLLVNWLGEKVPIIVKMAFKSESDGKKKLFFEY